MINILKMMEESCKVTIMADDKLYFESTFANNEVASKFIANWLISSRFRDLVEPVSKDLKIPDYIDGEESKDMTEVFNQVVEVPMVEEKFNDVTYTINKSNSYIIVGFENENHEMIFG